MSGCGQYRFHRLVVGEKDMAVKMAAKVQLVELLLHGHFNFTQHQCYVLPGKIALQLQQGLGAGIVYMVDAVALQNNITEAGLCMHALLYGFGNVLVVEKLQAIVDPDGNQVRPGGDVEMADIAERFAVGQAADFGHMGFGAAADEECK